MKKLYLLTLLSLMIAHPAFSQSIELTEQQIPQQGSFAQPFETRFAISYTPGYQVVLDKKTLPSNFGLAQEKIENLSPGTVSYDLTFLPFTLGASTFTAVTFQLQNSEGQTVSETAAEEVIVKIEPVSLFKDKKMRDIRPPYIPMSWMWWILALAALVLFILWMKHRRKKAEQNAQHSASFTLDRRPAHVIALSKIDLLLQSGLWEKQQYKIFYIELGEILREYFWRRFQLDVSADTSTELLRHTRTVPDLAPLYAELREYLKSSDLVKFAKYTPDEAKMRKDVGIVQKVVQKTTPVPSPAAAAQEVK